MKNRSPVSYKYVSTKEYVDKNKNKMKNITETQKRGIKSLIKRRNNKEIVIFQTDKTSKITVHSQNNYIEATITHIENNEIINEEILTKTEKEC